MTQPPAEVSWTETTARGIRLALLVVCVLGIVSTGTLIPPFYPDPSGLAVLGLALVAASQLLILAVLWRLGFSWWSSLAVFLLATMGLALAVSEMTAMAALSDTWWPRSILITTPSFLIVSRRRGWLLASALIAVNAVVHARVWEPSPSLPALSRFEEIAAETGQFVSYAAIAVIAVAVTSRAATFADEVVARGRQAREADAQGRMADTQGRAVDRFVHDEILHTLRIVAMDRSFIPGDQAVQVVTKLRRILGMEQRAPHEDGFVELLRSSIGDVGVDVRVEGSEGTSLPREVSEALMLAVRECLRNVAKHSGVGQAEVIVRRSGFALAVTVRDAGRGFDPERLHERLGLRESVVARMADIGGTARVVTADGRGTTVILRWSPIPEQRYAPREMGGGAVPELFPAIGWMILPVFIQGLWAAALLSHLVEPSELALIVTFIGVGVAAGALIWGMRRGLRGWQSVTLIGFTWACTVLNVALLPSGGAHPRLLWIAVTMTAVPSIISLFRPLTEAIVTSVGMSLFALVSLLLLHPSTPLSPYVTVLMAPLITLGIAVAVRRLVDRVAFEVWTQEERLRDHAEGLLADDFFANRLDDRLRGSRAPLLAFLDEIIDRPAVVEQDETRQTADLLERSLRDFTGQRMHPELGGVLTRLRLGGWTVRCRWADEAPEGVQRALAEALQGLPAKAPRGEAGAPPIVTAGAVRPQSEAPTLWRASVMVHPGRGSWASTYDLGPHWQVGRDEGLHAVTTITAGVASVPSAG